MKKCYVSGKKAKNSSNKYVTNPLTSGRAYDILTADKERYPHEKAKPAKAGGAKLQGLRAETPMAASCRNGYGTASDGSHSLFWGTRDGIRTVCYEAAGKEKRLLFLSAFVNRSLPY